MSLEILQTSIMETYYIVYDKRMNANSCGKEWKEWNKLVVYHFLEIAEHRLGILHSVFTKESTLSDLSIYYASKGFRVRVKMSKIFQISINGHKWDLWKIVNC